MGPSRWKFRFLLVACVAFSSACRREETVVRYRPILATVPGAVSATAPVGPRFEGEYVDPTSARNAEGTLASAELDDEGREKLYVEMPDGSKRLISPTGRHLMSHIINTIDDNEKELFLEQVLSEVTREEFLKRGLDPPWRSMSCVAEGPTS
jgi:hypothetical protein